MNQRQSQPSSNVRRQHQGQGRPARPSAHRRVHSYQNAAAQSQSSSRLTTASAKKAAREEVGKVDEEDGMAGLPQFCMTCERQMVNPGNSTLYCSRACQRRDSTKPPPIDPVVSPAFVSAPSYFDVPQPDILPQRSPTVLRPLSMTFSDYHLSDSGSPSDADEAEARRSQRHSDTTRYYNHLDDDATNDETFPLKRRPGGGNRSSTSTLPSLSHTPSSSVGTAASFSSYRPLPARHEGHRHMKSADLVIPTFPSGPASLDNSSVKSSASTLTSFHAAEAGDVSYAKQQGWQQQQQQQQQQSPARGSLRQLFGHEAMVGTPKGRRSGGVRWSRS